MFDMEKFVKEHSRFSYQFSIIEKNKDLKDSVFNGRKDFFIINNITRLVFNAWTDDEKKEERLKLVVTCTLPDVNFRK